MRFLGQVAGKKLRLSSWRVGLCFHSAATETVSYLYLGWLGELAVTPSLELVISCGNFLCASLVISDPESPRFSSPHSALSPLLVTSSLTWPMFLQSQTPPALAVASWQPAEPSSGSAVQDVPSADPVTGAVVQRWWGWGYHWLTTSWLKRAGQRQKLWFTRMLCYFCPCFYPLWFHFLNKCRSVHRLRILYVRSSHPSRHPHHPIFQWFTAETDPP